MDLENTAVRFIFDSRLGFEDREWIQEEVFDEWFGGELPKLCILCDNVYRYSADNHSILTRGLKNMTNRRRLAQLLEVNEFLSVKVKKIGSKVQAEYQRYDLNTEAPVETRVSQLDKPWF